MRIRTDGRGGQADGRRVRRMHGRGDRRMDGGQANGRGERLHLSRNSILKSNPRFVERDILGYIIKDYY
jgi:hypothetical protein